MKPGKLFTHLHASYQGEKTAEGERKGRMRGFWAIDAEAELAANQWQMLMGAGERLGEREVGEGKGVGNSSQNECHVQMSCQSMDTLQ